MKIAVIYKSKTGFVKKYAEWIAEALSADILEASSVKPEKLNDYDAVIYGGGLYAVGINGVKFIKQNLDILKGKKVAVFASGASPFREAILNEVRDKNFTAEEQKLLRFFYLRGGFDFDKLPFFLKIVMRLMKWNLSRKKELTSDEAGMLAAFKEPVNFTDKKNIEELVAFIRS